MQLKEIGVNSNNQNKQLSKYAKQIDAVISALAEQLRINITLCFTEVPADKAHAQRLTLVASGQITEFMTLLNNAAQKGDEAELLRVIDTWFLTIYERE